MSSGSAIGKRRRARGSRSMAEVLRALVVTAALAGILLLAIFVTSSTYFADHQIKGALSKIAPLSQSIGGEAAHRVASIVVETDRKGR